MDFQSIYESSRDGEDQETASAPSAAPPPPSSTLNSTTEPALQAGGALPGFRKDDTGGTRRVLPTSMVGAGVFTPRPEEVPDFQPRSEFGSCGPYLCRSCSHAYSDTESPQARQLREKLERQWATSSPNSTTFRAALRGAAAGGGGAVSFANLILWMVGLLPVSTFAYPFERWNKIPVASLPIFVTRCKSSSLTSTLQ